MRLVIRAKSLRNQLLSQTIVGEFDERGGTIGRSDSNTMTLPDPERHVSRLQAEVAFADGTFSIRNVGSSNPIIVGGRPVSPGEAVPLRHGQAMTIGGYELQASLGEGADSRARSGSAAKPVDARTVIGASAKEGRTNPPRHGASTPAVDPFAGLLGAATPAGAADPFADLLGTTPPRQFAASAKPSRGQSPMSPSTPTPSAAASLPDDFDPFAEISPSPPDVNSEETPFGDLVGDKRSAPGSLDTLFGLNTAAPGASDPLEAFMSSASEGAASSPTDPFAFLEDGLSSKAAAVGPAAADDTPELRGAYVPPPVRAAAPDMMFDNPPVARVLAARPQNLAPSADVIGNGPPDELWIAFCEGAHLSVPRQQHLTPELMRLIGSTLRQAVEGTVQLNAVRTTAKQELHVAVTTIQSKNNNPLKFAPDASAVLAQLLQPPMRGFMAAPEAVQDVMADLLGHAVGTMAGTRAAMQGMLERFEPAQLESQLARGGVLDALLPMNRRARLWELYLQHYERISESAREDFHELFGKAFVKAYEEQADQIAAARRKPR